MAEPDNRLISMRGKLIVSCQPVVGGPMDNSAIVTGLALAAECGGAAGLRIAGADSVRNLRRMTTLPIIGITKRDLPNSPVRITPLLDDVDALVAAGADIIAYDATLRSRPIPTETIAQRIRELGALAMADCACVEDGRRALSEGTHILGTTLSGYAYAELPENSPPDLNLVREFAALDAFVIAEGRIRTPDEAAEAISHGADSVVVGSAITRVEHITSWFADAVEAASSTPASIVRS